MIILVVLVSAGAGAALAVRVCRALNRDAGGPNRATACAIAAGSLAAAMISGYLWMLLAYRQNECETGCPPATPFDEIAGVLALLFTGAAVAAALWGVMGGRRP